jgi:hypothetical protein
MTAPAAPHTSRVAGGLFDPRQLAMALPEAVRKLDPRLMWHNPVMLIVEVGAVFTTVLAVTDPSVFAGLITGWLWATVVFANLAEAVAEGRGKAQADTLRKTRQGTIARRVTGWHPGMLISGADAEEIPAPKLDKGDIVVVEAGEIIPGDGDVVEGIASVDESAITGESAPVIRESGGDRSAVTGGTKVLSDRIVVHIRQPAAAAPGRLGTHVPRRDALPPAVHGPAPQEARTRPRTTSAPPDRTRHGLPVHALTTPGDPCSICALPHHLVLHRCGDRRGRWGRRGCHGRRGWLVGVFISVAA